MPKDSVFNPDAHIDYSPPPEVVVVTAPALTKNDKIKDDSIYSNADATRILIDSCIVSTRRSAPSITYKVASAYCNCYIGKFKTRSLPKNANDSVAKATIHEWSEECIEELSK